MKGVKGYSLNQMHKELHPWCWGDGCLILLNYISILCIIMMLFKLELGCLMIYLFVSVCKNFDNNIIKRVTKTF